MEYGAAFQVVCFKQFETLNPKWLQLCTVFSTPNSFQFRTLFRVPNSFSYCCKFNSHPKRLESCLSYEVARFELIVVGFFVYFLSDVCRQKAVFIAAILKSPIFISTLRSRTNLRKKWDFGPKCPLSAAAKCRFSKIIKRTTKPTLRTC